jgi:putative ABC transport system permease protein
MVIAVCSAAIGLPLAYGAVRAIAVIGGEALPRADGLRFDLGVALFAAGVMAIAGIIVGLLPAFTAVSARLTPVTSERGRGGTPGARTRRLLGALVVSEITLAIVLVAGAGRLAMSANNLLAVDPGFRAEGRLIVDASLPGRVYGPDPARRNAWSDEIAQRLRALGATHVGMATSLPLRRESDTTTFTDIVGRPVQPQFRPNGRLRVVNPEFFDTLEIRVSRGRAFTEADRFETERVVMVNEAWVAKFLPPDADPLRERIAGLFARRVDNKFVTMDATIIGVVSDVLYAGLDKRPEPVVYQVDTQSVALRRSYVLTAADGNPERWIPQIREAFRALDPMVAVQFDSMPNVVTASLVWSRLGVLLLGTFGVVSLVLAGAGVFGVMAFVGAQRHGEMAVRLSLGATRSRVFMMMLVQGVRFTAIGCAAGTVLSWWAGRLMSGYVFQVSASNAAVLLGSAAIVGLVALAAAAAPARRAAAVEPSTTLRA